MEAPRDLAELKALLDSHGSSRPAQPPPAIAAFMEQKWQCQTRCVERMRAQAAEAQQMVYNDLQREMVGHRWTELMKQCDVLCGRQCVSTLENS